MSNPDYQKYVFNCFVDNYVKWQSPLPGHYSPEQLADFVQKGQLVQGEYNPPVVIKGAAFEPEKKATKKG